MNAAPGTRTKPILVWTILPLLQVLLLCALASGANRQEWLIFISFIIITGFASWKLFADKQAYSINKIWWIFGIAFLGIAPSVQTALHHSPWHEGDIDPQTILYANGLILVSFLLYCGVRYLVRRKQTPVARQAVIIPSQYVARFHVAAPVVMLICGIALLVVYGWKSFFLRGYFEAASQQYNPTFQLVFDKGVRGIILYLSLATIQLYHKKKLSGLYCALMLGLALLFNFPLAIPRNLAFTICVSWLVTAGFSFIKSRYGFATIILAAVLLAAPLADVTRYAGTDMQRRLANPIALFKQAYLVSDYDAYSSLCRTIQFVDTAGHTNGRQAAGVVLFFVPRKIWPQKPIGSGSYLFTQLNFDFKNVSCTYFAEGYINFGFAGTLLFVIIIALIITLYDNWYLRHSETFLYPQLFYPVFMGMMLFILRGDLLSSYAYTCGLFVSGWIVHRLLMFRAK